MRLCCPSCRGEMEVAGETPPAEILCTVCGSSFRLDSLSTTGVSQDQGQGRLGKFVLLGTLGTGACGTVYRARDTDLNRVVALKVPHPGRLDGPAGAERSCARPAAPLACGTRPSSLSTRSAPTTAPRSSSANWWRG